MGGTTYGIVFCGMLCTAVVCTATATATGTRIVTAAAATAMDYVPDMLQLCVFRVKGS